MTRSYAPKHTKNYNKDAVEKARSIFLPQADSEITTDLSVSIQFWLRKRGQNVQTPMTDHQKGQLKECFELIDTDGSGSLDVRELFELFDVSCWHVLTCHKVLPGRSLAPCAFLTGLRLPAAADDGAQD